MATSRHNQQQANPDSGGKADGLYQQSKPNPGGKADGAYLPANPKPGGKANGLPPQAPQQLWLRTDA